MGVGDMGVGGVGAFVQQLHLRWGDAEQVFVLAAAHKQHTLAPAAALKPHQHGHAWCVRGDGQSGEEPPRRCRVVVYWRGTTAGTASRGTLLPF